MVEFDCSTGCLRYELDENKETLNDAGSKHKDNFESAESEPISKEAIDGFKRLIDSFETDLDLFKEHCLKCKKNGGKLKGYEDALQKAKELWEILSC